MSTTVASACFMDTVPCAAIKSCLPESVKPISEVDDIDTLARMHRARLLRFAAYSTGDPDLAETIAQDTLLRAYNGRESFRGECSVNTWLTGIAIHVIRDHQRSNKYKFWKRVKSSAIDVHDVAAFIPAGGSGPEGQLLAKEKVKHLVQVIGTLSNNQRTVFLMKFSEDMSTSDISKVQGVSEVTVRTHLHRALKTVRSQLGASV